MKFLKNNKVSDVDLTESLQILSKILYIYFKTKVFIIIDEYDATINWTVENIEDINLKKYI